MDDTPAHAGGDPAGPEPVDPRLVEEAHSFAQRSGKATTLILWSHAVLAPHSELPTYCDHHVRNIAGDGAPGVSAGAVEALRLLMVTISTLLPTGPATYHPDHTGTALVGELASLPPLSLGAVRYIELVLDNDPLPVHERRFAETFAADRDHRAMFEAAVALGQRLVVRHNPTQQPWIAYNVLGHALTTQWSSTNHLPGER